MTSIILAHATKFDQFWRLYPRKTVKKLARIAWNKAVLIADPDTIIDGLIHYAFSSEAHYQPHPSTWLNQERWQYEPNTTPICVTHDRDDSGATRMVRSLHLDLLTPLDELYPNGTTPAERPTARSLLGNSPCVANLWGANASDRGTDRPLRHEVGD